MRGLVLCINGKSITVLLMLLSCLSGIAVADEPYKKNAEMICGDTKVRVITECYDDSNILPACSKQEFEFMNNTGGTTIKKAASGKLEDDFDVNPPKKALDALASRLQCVRGKAQSYLVVMYYNGGNCEKCEWSEILDLEGKKVSTDWPKTKKSMEKYDKAWKRLGLKEPEPGGHIPDSQFMKIPLRKKDK